MAHVGKNGKGDKKFKRTGESFNYYARVHRWITYHYGKASKCDNVECTKESKLFQWALLKGKKHEKNIDNYMQMCRKCHAKYDYDEEIWKNWHQREWSAESKLKISKAHKGKKISEKHKEKLSKLFSGEGNPMYGKNKKGTEHPFYGKKHKIESREKMAKNRQVLSKETILMIKLEHKQGIKQREIAIKYNISNASVCRIVNNKRYVLCQ